MTYARRNLSDPSGVLNKTCRLLDKSKRNIRKFYKLYRRHYSNAKYVSTLIKRYPQSSRCVGLVKCYISWESAYTIAYYCLLHNVNDPSDILEKSGLNLQFEPSLFTLFSSFESLAKSDNDMSINKVSRRQEDSAIFTLANMARIGENKDGNNE